MRKEFLRFYKSPKESPLLLSSLCLCQIYTRPHHFDRSPNNVRLLHLLGGRKCTSNSISTFCSRFFSTHSKFFLTPPQFSSFHFQPLPHQEAFLSSHRSMKPIVYIIQAFWQIFKKS